MGNYRIGFGNPVIGKAGRAKVIDCLDRQWVTRGTYVTQFEEEWGKTFGTKHNIMMGSGTAACTNAVMSLYDLGAKPGDEVIVPALSFIATSNAVRAAGLRPKWVDVERDSMNIDPTKIEDEITPLTRAIKVVHTMGKPVDMDPIMQIAEIHNINVIEDACEAHGATYKDRKVGSMGDMSIYSCFAAHLIFAVEAGVVSTNNPEIADVLRSTMDHGREGIYFQHDRFGVNSKPSDLHAAIGLEGITNFWDTFNKRRNNLDHLITGTRDLSEYATFNYEEEHETISPHAFSITLKNPEHDAQALYAFLEDEGKGIQCKRNFGSIPTQHKAFDQLKHGHEPGDFPNAEYIGDNGLHFGIHQTVTNGDLDYALERIHSYFEKF